MDILMKFHRVSFIVMSDVFRCSHPAAKQKWLDNQLRKARATGHLGPSFSPSIIPIDPSAPFLSPKLIGNVLHLHCSYCDHTWGMCKWDLNVVYKHCGSDEHSIQERRFRTSPESHAPLRLTTIGDISSLTPSASVDASPYSLHSTHTAPPAQSSASAAAADGQEGDAPSATPNHDTNLPTQPPPQHTPGGAIGHVASPSAEALKDFASSPQPTRGPPTHGPEASSPAPYPPQNTDLASRQSASPGIGTLNVRFHKDRPRSGMYNFNTTYSSISDNFVHTVLASKNPRLRDAMNEQTLHGVPARYVAEYTRLAKCLNLTWGAIVSRLSESQTSDELCRQLGAGTDAYASGCSQRFLVLQASIFESHLLLRLSATLDSVDWFSISLDACGGRMSVRVLYWQGKTHSAPLGLFDWARDHAESLYLLLHSLPTIGPYLAEKLVAIVCDGFEGNNKLGKLLGVPHINWCVAHRIDLLASAVWNDFTPMNDVTPFFCSLAGFFRESSTHAQSVAQFTSMLQDADWYTSRSQYANTRWNSRHKPLCQFITACRAIIAELRSIACTDTSGKRRNWAIARLDQINSLFLLSIAIFADCSTLLQTAITRVQKATGSMLASIAATRDFLKALRNYRHTVSEHLSTSVWQGGPELYIGDLFTQLTNHPESFSWTAARRTKTTRTEVSMNISIDDPQFYYHHVVGSVDQVVNSYTHFAKQYLSESPIPFAWERLTNIDGVDPDDPQQCEWKSSLDFIFLKYNFVPSDQPECPPGAVERWFQIRQLARSYTTSETEPIGHDAAWGRILKDLITLSDPLPRDSIDYKLRFLVQVHHSMVSNSSANERDFSVHAFLGNL